VRASKSTAILREKIRSRGQQKRAQIERAWRTQNRRAWRALPIKILLFGATAGARGGAPGAPDLGAPLLSQGGFYGHYVSGIRYEVSTFSGARGGWRENRQRLARPL